MPFFFPAGITIALPSGLNVIVTLVPDGGVPEKGFPVANVVLNSEGLRLCAASGMSFSAAKAEKPALQMMTPTIVLRIDTARFYEGGRFVSIDADCCPNSNGRPKPRAGRPSSGMSVRAGGGVRHKHWCEKGRS